MPNPAKLRLAILGTRGLSSGQSGLESLVARLAPYLVRAGWDVDVCCQYEDGNGPPLWENVKLVQIPVGWLRRKRKAFFFEKKKQKTFISVVTDQTD